MSVFRGIFLGLVAAAVGALPLTEARAALYDPKHIKVSLIAESAVPVENQDFWVGVLFEPEDHWHIYWKNPGDSGLPPTIKWDLPEGGRAGEIRWPAPERLPIPPLMDYGYEGPTLFMVPLRLPANAVNGVISAKVDWLVCREVCVPGRAKLELKLPAASVSPSYFESTRRQLPQPQGDLKASARLTQAEFELILNREFENPVFFPAEAAQIDNVAQQVLSRLDQGGSVLKLKRSDQLAGSVSRLRGLIQHGPAGRREAIEVEASVQGEDLGAILQAVFFAFLGGILLNLMPCVFPVLSIKILAFAQTDSSQGSKIRRDGWLYFAGVLASFWVLTGVLLVLRAAGDQIGWGFQLQSPGFIVFLACLLFFMGLNLMGVFELGGSLQGAGQGLVSAGGASGAFFTGVLAAVVSTPCSAPFMGTAVGFALAQPGIVTWVILTSLGIGLSLPFVALCYHPAWMRRLPRPGRWMETLKQVLSFPIFGTVVWLVWVFGLQTGVDGVLFLLVGLLLVSIAAWMLGRYPSRRVGVVALVLLGISLAIPLRRGEVLKAEPFSPARVAELRAASKPVFVDFTAAWCVSCKVNELVALSPQVVRDKFQEHGVTFMRADWTLRDPQITQALAEHGRSAVPLYVLYYGPSGKSVAILPEVLTPQIVLDALDKVGSH